jgi:hypothetical protein
MKFVNQLILVWMVAVFASCSKYQSENVNSIVLESGGYNYRQKKLILLIMEPLFNLV